MAVGLGLFGVITRVVLEIQPTYRVRQDVYVGAPWDGVLEAFDEIMAGAYSVSLLGDPGSPVLAQIWQKTRVGDEPPAAAPESLHGGRWYDDADVPAGIRAQPAGGRRRARGPSGCRTSGSTHRRRWAATSCRPSTSSPAGTPSTPCARCGALGERISPHLHAAEIRTVAVDDLWLSPAYERDSVTHRLHLAPAPEPVHALIGEVEAALAGFGARPHWGKLHRFTAADLARALPRLPDALDLARSHDPTGKFAGDLC